MQNTGVLRARKPPRPGTTLFALSFAGLCASFMQTLLVPIQGELPTLLNAPLEVTTWAITITQLISTVWMPIAGRLADMYGKRKVVLAMVLLLILGSLLAAIATNIWVLLVARAIQGAGFGVIVTGISLLRDIMPPERLATSVAVVSATLGVGGALGMPLAAVVAENFDWRALFWLVSALSVTAFVLVCVFVPPSAIRTGGRVDWLGMIGLTIGVSLILLLISNGSSWPIPVVLGAGATAVIVFAVWAWHELRTKAPLVDLRVNTSPSVLLSNFTGLTMGFALFAPQVAFPLLLTMPSDFGGMGVSSIEASFVIMPMGFAMLAMSPVAGRLERHWGAKFVVTAGSVLMAIGYLLTLFVEPTVWSILASAIIIGSGTGLGYAAMPALIMSSVPVSETGSANGLNALMRSLGTALAASITAGVLAIYSVQVGGEIGPSSKGFSVIFIIATGAAIAAAILSALIPNTKRLGDTGTVARPEFS
ncbi:MAG: MFS transporter [Gulosibacter sp.]|uniref:MFS transporter n=1 Tax=Gulosibacter sp. TaxID=2817531 RepID=UPI003F8F4E19